MKAIKLVLTVLFISACMFACAHHVSEFAADSKKMLEGASSPVMITGDH